MNKAIKLGLGVAVMSLILLGGVSTVIADSPPAPAPAGGTFDQRLAQRKQERNIVVSDVDQLRLESTCIGGQAKVRSVQSDMVPMLANRTKVYQQIDAKLYITIGQLKLANKDTFELEKERLKLTDKTANFQAIASSFTQTLDDIQVINCRADVGGFMALLNTARLYYTQLQVQSADSRNYIVNTIKPELANHISDLQSKNATDGGN